MNFVSYFQILTSGSKLKKKKKRKHEEDTEKGKDNQGFLFALLYQSISMEVYSNVLV